MEQGIVPLGKLLSRPEPPELLEDELLGAAALVDADVGAALDTGETEVDVSLLELVVGSWMNWAASVEEEGEDEEEEEEEDELVLVEDVLEVVWSGITMKSPSSSPAITTSESSMWP